MKKIRVSRCMYCPHHGLEFFKPFGKYIYFCTTKQRIVYDENSIPDWCGLEDEDALTAEEFFCGGQDEE